MQRYRVVIMVVLFGVLPVVIAFFVALHFLELEALQAPQPPPPVVDETPQPKPPERKPVLAAARPLPVGTLLGEDDLTVLELDPAEIPKGSIHVSDDDTQGETPSSLRGHAVREAIAEGAPLLRSAVVGPGDQGFLAAVLMPGSRAVTIQVGEATSQAGLIDPGDRVDVILSAELSIDAGDRIAFARTIVEDVRVVAIDNRTDHKPENPQIITATLEASPAQADRLVLGEHEGRLSLAVRPLADSTLARNVHPGDAVELREMLLSSPDFNASEARLQRVQELSDLSIRKELVESKEQFRAAVEAGARRRDAVRVFRGAAPAEEVVFERRRSP